MTALQTYKKMKAVKKGGGGEGGGGEQLKIKNVLNIDARVCFESVIVCSPVCGDWKQLLKVNIEYNIGTNVDSHWP